MMRDSNHSDWLYIIKSGSVDVVKKLVRPKDNSNAVKAFSTGGSGNSCWVDCTKRRSRPQTTKGRIVALQDSHITSRIGNYIHSKYHQVTENQLKLAVRALTSF